MLEVGSSIYFIDAGAPLIEEFLKIKTEDDLKRIRGIFTTHAHTDHIAGIFHIATLMDWYYKLPLDLYLTEDRLTAAFNELYRATNGGTDFGNGPVKFHTLSPDFVYEDENIKLSFIPTAHMKAVGSPTYAILLSAEGKQILFSGDLSYKLKFNDVPKAVTEEHLDLFICEMAHFGVEELKPTLDGCLADRVYFNHVFDNSKFEDIRALSECYPFEIRAVDDGEIIEL